MIVPWVMLGSVLAVTVALRLPMIRRHFGLYGCLFYFSSIAWLVVVTIQLARIAS